MNKFSEIQKTVLTIIREKIEKEYFYEVVSKFKIPNPDELKHTLKGSIKSDIVEESKNHLEIKNKCNENMQSVATEELLNLIEEKMAKQ